MEAIAAERVDTENSIRISERAAISRELHNSTSQLLAALRSQLEELRQIGGDETTLNELAEVIREIDMSIRSIGVQSRREESDWGILGNPQNMVAKKFYSVAALDRANV